MVSRKLARGDWAGAFEILVDLGEQLLEVDPVEFAWHAFRGLQGTGTRAPDRLELGL
jgi:hypothetical protein